MDNVEVVGEAGDGLELLRLLRDTPPQLVIMDISMPNLRGLEATREIKIIDPGVKVLILTMHKEREYLYHALTAGAEGYLAQGRCGRGVDFGYRGPAQRRHLYLTPAVHPDGRYFRGEISAGASPGRRRRNCSPSGKGKSSSSSPKANPARRSVDCSLSAAGRCNITAPTS